MAIKAGQILHVMNQFIVDRIQTAGGNLNIPTERVHELGNYQSVGIVRDVPDLSFDLDVLDVGTRLEALLAGTGATNPEDDPEGTVYNLLNAKPIDILSPMKAAHQGFDIVKSVVVPQLTLESASYRYGLQENAGEQFTLQGDALFYVPGTAWQVDHEGDGTTAAFDYGDAGTALKYVEQGQDIYALNVSVDGERQTAGADADYTEDDSGITFNAGHEPADGTHVRIVVGSATAQHRSQDSTHRTVSIKPAAIRGKDIQVLVQGERWPGVQSVNVDWRVDLEDDFEFGSPRAVSREAVDAPEVTGSIELRPRDPEAFFARLREMSGITDETQVIGPQSSVPVTVEVRLHNPDSGGAEGLDAGALLKTLYVPDARFTIPGYEGRVQQKLDPTCEFESDTGVLETIKGEQVAWTEGISAESTHDAVGAGQPA